MLDKVTGGNVNYPPSNDNNLGGTMEKYIDEKTLAERWMISLGAIRARRLKGQEPKYLKIGSSVRYSIDEIEKFEKNNTVAPT